MNKAIKTLITTSNVHNKPEKFIYIYTWFSYDQSAFSFVVFTSVCLSFSHDKCVNISSSKLVKLALSFVSLSFSHGKRVGRRCYIVPIPPIATPPPRGKMAIKQENN